MRLTMIFVTAQQMDILLLLSVRPLTAAEMVKAFRDASSGWIILRYAAVHRSCTELVRKGLLEKVMESESGRLCYKITPKGFLALRQMETFRQNLQAHAYHPIPLG
jgi:DNA-binding PadR family transcriptional regulator